MEGGRVMGKRTKTQTRNELRQRDKIKIRRLLNDAMYKEWETLETERANIRQHKSRLRKTSPKRNALADRELEILFAKGHLEQNLCSKYNLPALYNRITFTDILNDENHVLMEKERTAFVTGPLDVKGYLPLKVNIQAPRKMIEFHIERILDTYRLALNQKRVDRRSALSPSQIGPRIEAGEKAEAIATEYAEADNPLFNEVDSETADKIRAAWLQKVRRAHNKYLSSKNTA